MKGRRERKKNFFSFLHPFSIGVIYPCWKVSSDHLREEKDGSKRANGTETHSPFFPLFLLIPLPFSSCRCRELREEDGEEVLVMGGEGMDSKANLFFYFFFPVLFSFPLFIFRVCLVGLTRVSLATDVSFRAAAKA